MKLSLGPVLYYWSREDLLAFYRDVADWPVDVVYLGETVCSKRRSLDLDDWIAVGHSLREAGKEVVLSALALLEAESELMVLRRLCANGEFLVEANDMGAVGLLAGQARFVSGPTVNVYNPRTLAILASQGLTRWVLPVELSRDTLAAMQAARPACVETELFAYGRLPLALSARCFTARAHKLPKDDCQLRCIDYPDGMLVETQEGQPFLALNGIQTQSAQTFSLLPELADIAALGVDVLRISPQRYRTDRVIGQFRAALDGTTSPVEAERAVRQWMPAGPCDGYWQGRPGISATAV